MKIPFLDLKAQHAAIRDEINTAIGEVLDSCAFAGGPFVEEFEEAFARTCHCHYAIGVGSGTEALWLTLLALGIGPDDEVITVPNTFIATAEAISFCGAKPVFVDIDERTYTLDPEKLRDHLKKCAHGAGNRPLPKAVIPVHLYGQMADMGPILEVAQEYGLHVVEDACQAHGAEYKGKSAGSLGDTGCFSFYPGKNLGACGEAGAVVTNNRELADRIRVLRDHGQHEKYHHYTIGWNARMDGIQAAVLKVKLKHLQAWNKKRRENASKYHQLLQNLDILRLPVEEDYAKHVYHLYVVRLANRDRCVAYLAENGIQCGIHYPVPIHLQRAYRFLGRGKGSFPIAEKCANEIISLPMYPELTEAQMQYIVEYLAKFLEKHSN